MDKYKTVLSDRKKETELQCKAEGVPDVTFSWSFEGVIVSGGKPNIKHATTKLDHFMWKSVLTIEEVKVKSFGAYKCVARNEIGFDTAEINLIPDSKDIYFITSRNLFLHYVLWNVAFLIKFLLQILPERIK